MARIEKVVARFEDYEAFKDALRALKERRTREYTAYGPTRLDEVENLMPHKGSLVRGFATFGAIAGLVSFWLMCVISALIYNLVVGGKPPVSNVPYIVPAYEGTILVGSLFAFISAIAFALLGPRRLPEDYDPRFSQDSYGIEVYCRPKERERITELLQSAGAVEIYESE